MFDMAFTSLAATLGHYAASHTSVFVNCSKK